VVARFRERLSEGNLTKIEFDKDVYSFAEIGS